MDSIDCTAGSSQSALAVALPKLELRQASVMSSDCFSTVRLVCVPLIRECLVSRIWRDSDVTSEIQMNFSIYLTESAMVLVRSCIEQDFVR